MPCGCVKSPACSTKRCRCRRNGKKCNESCGCPPECYNPMNAPKQDVSQNDKELIKNISAKPIDPDINTDSSLEISSATRGLRLIAYEDLEIDTPPEVLGQGGQAQVIRAKWLGQDVAVKKFNVSSAKACRAYMEAVLKKEIEVLTIVSGHPNLVELKGYLYDPEKKLLAVVLEYAPFGSLAKFLECCILTPSQRLEIGKQVLEGIAFLHSYRISHRDIKPDNILIFQNEPVVVKVSDFGLVRQQLGTATRATAGAGTPSYMSPEVALHSARNREDCPIDLFASDVFSIGVLFFELFSGEPFFPHQYSESDICESFKEYGANGQSGWKPNVQGRLGRAISGTDFGNENKEMIIKLVEDCIAFKPSNRPSLQEILTRFSSIML